MRRIVFLVLLANFPVVSFAEAKVYCTQAIVQRMWVYPLPFFRTFSFATAAAEANFLLAKARQAKLRDCEEDAKNSQNLIWCSMANEECNSSDDQFAKTSQWNSGTSANQSVY